MAHTAKSAALDHILPWRALYRQEMNCQIIHDSIHARAGWTEEYRLFAGDVAVGYGSIAVSGPWKDKPTIYEFYVLPHYRLRMFDLFGALLAELFPAPIRATAQGLCYNVGRGASALAPFVIGALADEIGVGAALACTSLFFLAGAATSLLLPKTEGEALA